MATGKDYRIGLVIVGDAKGGIQAVHATSQALDQLEKKQTRANVATKAHTNSFTKLNNTLNSTRTLMGGVALAAAGMITGKLIGSAAIFEKGLVGIGKTTDLVGSDLEGLGEEIEKLSVKTGISTAELLKIGTVAGQLGVRGVSNLALFTEAVGKMTRTTDLGAEAAAGSLAVLLNLTGESADNVLGLASVITALGNSSAANEAKILHMTEKLAQMTAQFKLSSTDLVAFGATLAGLGQRAEGASSAMGIALRTMISATGDELDALNKLVGATGDQFTKALGEDAATAFSLFLRELGKVEGAKEQIKLLASLGLKSAEISRVIPVLAQSFDKLESNIKKANKESKEREALDKEFIRTLDTFLGQWGRFKAVLDEVAKSLGGPVITQLTRFFKVLADEHENGMILEFNRQYFDQSVILGVLSGAYGGLRSAVVATMKAIDDLSEAEKRAANGKSKGDKRTRLGDPRNSTIVIDYTKLLGKLDKATTKSETKVDKLAAAFKAQANETGILGTELNTFINSLDSSSEDIDIWLKGLDDWIDKTIDLGEETFTLLDVLDPLAALTRKLAKDEETLNKALEAGIIDSKEYALALVQLADGFDKAQKDAIKLANKADPLAKEFELAIERIDDALFNVFRHGLDSFGDFKDVVLDGLRDIAAQAALTFTKNLFGFSASGIASGAVGSGIGGSIAGAIGGSAIGQSISAFVSAGGSALLNNFGISQASGAAFAGPAGSSGVPTAQIAIGGADGGFNVGGYNINPVEFLKSAGLASAGGFIGTSVGGALFDKDANSSIGATTGAIIGSVIPGIGTFLGAAIGGLFDSLFGGGRHDPKVTVRTTNDAAQELNRPSHRDFGIKTASPFGNVESFTQHDFFGETTFADAQATYGDFFQNIAAIETFLAGTLDETVNQAIKGAIASQPRTVSEGGNITEFFQVRFNTIFDTIGGDMNDIFDSLTEGLSETEFVGALDNIVQTTLLIANGKDEMRTFLKQFESFADLTDIAAEHTKALNEVFDGLGRELPNTAEGFKDLLESLDLMDEQQRNTFGILLALVPDLDAHYQNLNRVVIELSSNVEGLIENIFGSTSLDSLIAIERNRLEESNVLAEELFATEQRRFLESIAASESLAKTADGLLLGADSPLNASERYAEALRQYNELLAAATTGNAQSANELAQFAPRFIEEARSFYASGDNFDTQFDVVQADLARLSQQFDIAAPLTPDDGSTSIILEDLLARQAAEIAAAISSDSAELLEALIGLAQASDLTVNEVLGDVGLTLANLLELLDTDRSGDTSIEELMASIIDDETKAILASLDTNSDGFIDITEALDTNLDGILDLLELSQVSDTQLVKLFESLDTNQDGVLDGVELLGRVTEDLFDKLSVGGIALQDGSLILALRELAIVMGAVPPPHEYVTALDNFDFSGGIAAAQAAVAANAANNAAEANAGSLLNLTGTNESVITGPQQLSDLPQWLVNVNNSRVAKGQGAFSSVEEFRDSINTGVGIQAFASGGILTSAQVIMAGEAGNEAVVPLDEFYAKLDEVVRATRENTAALDFYGEQAAEQREKALTDSQEGNEDLVSAINGSVTTEQVVT